MNDINPLLDAIQTDDVNLFSSLIGGEKASLCMGRFPLLSLCYLYKARKIVARFEKQLIITENYNIVEEPPCIYPLFKQVAGKNLRLYLEETIISPLEMLALMEESQYLSKAYKKLPISDTINNNIIKIYDSRNQTVIIKDNRIITPKKKLSPLKKTLILSALLLALVMTLTPLISYYTLGKSFGRGTKEAPYLISSAKQFSLAYNSKKHFKLTKDITIDGSYGDFLSSLDGGGKTIFISNPQSPLIANLKGSISNLNIVFDNYSGQVTSDMAFIATTNSGTMSNLNVSLKADIVKNDIDTDLSVAVFAILNTGTIAGCNLDIDITFNSFSSGNTFISGYVVNNKGTIDNCTTTQDSAIITDTVDIAGIACVNDTGGTIKYTTNNAFIKQTTASGAWFATIAGIALENYGSLYYCTNRGQLALETMGLMSDIPEELKENNPELTRLESYAAGIAYANYGAVKRCKNDADISGLSNEFTILLAGVVSANLNLVVTSCSYGTLSVQSTDLEAPHYVAGIATINRYGIASCYTAIDYDVDSSVHRGGIVALWVTINGQYYNNYYLSRGSVVDSDTTGIASVDTLEALMNLSIYWG